nr:MAG TPA: hypothetical protein [Caudoviricetes sp.]
MGTKTGVQTYYYVIGVCTLHPRVSTDTCVRAKAAPALVRGWLTVCTHPRGVNGNSAFRRFSIFSTTESNERGSL